MNIVNMNTLTKKQLSQAAQILTDSLPWGWDTFNDAVDEINERLIPENTLLAMLEENVVIGFGGILPIYDGKVFELHPLAVRANKRGIGIGSKIVLALEDEARSRGGFTMWLGADDEVEGGETSFANVDLYDNFPKQLIEFTPGTHQSAFYMKLGYKIMGVLPNANGIGKPDIFLAKNL